MRLPWYFVLTQEFGSQEAELIRYMNENQLTVMLDYVAMRGVTVNQVVMVGVDGDGFDLRVDTQLMRFDFNEPVTTIEQARQVILSRDVIRV